MKKLKERTLKELYSGTESILEPEITPVLRGSCRMRGPVGETDDDTWTNTVLSRDGSGSGYHSMSQKVHLRTESGTCNVCCAPCSSCMHFNRALMGLKVDESPDETCRREADSQYSINEGDGLPFIKSEACDNLQHTASETSNILRGIEGHDDNNSCASGANDANILVKYDSMSVDRNKVLCSSASVSNLGPVTLGKDINYQTGSGNPDLNFDVEESHQNLRRQSRCMDDSMQLPPIELLTAQVPSKFDLSNFPVPKDGDTSLNSPKVHSPYSQSGSRKSPTGNLVLKDIDEDLSSLCQRKLPDLSIEPMDSSLTKEAAFNILSSQKSERADIFHMTEGSYKVCGKNYLESEAETDKDSGYLRDDALRCSGQNNQAAKIDDEAELRDMLEPPLQPISCDESGDSDIVEHDVKVCDICGDAGREDLLAVCSRCSDGAEHTYCMREMLDKVPEEEWLCDECKLNDEPEKQKQDKAKIVNENEKKQCPGHTSSVRTDKLDTKDSDMEANKTKKVSPSMHVSRKRPSDNIDVDSTVKRQALETSTGSPKVCSPSRTSALSRDSSFKNLDKGKVKLAHQMSFGTSTTSPRFQTSRGNLLKSNSFNSLNNKPRVKPADDVIPHKQKGATKLGSFESKEGPLKVMGKSISFKSANSARSSAPESKVKMLSPRFPHFEDIRGLRKAKERNTFERKNLSKSDAPMVSLAAASSIVSALKGDQKLTSRGESILHPSASNFRDSKPVQTEGKFTSSKPIGSLARKALELSGEDKRHSFSLNAVGASSSNGMCSSAEEKPNLVKPKEEPSESSSQITERPSISAHDLDEELPFSRESTNQAERTGENLIPRSRQGVTSGGRGVYCHRCKDTGHATHLCTITSPRASSADASATKSSVDAMNKGNKLKAAIHAAMLKKPGIYKKSRVPDQSDELSLSSTNLNCEVASQEQLSVSSHFRCTIAGKQEGHTFFMGNTADSCRQTNSNAKQVTVHPESIYSFRTGDSDAVMPSDGKLNMREFPSHASAMMSVFLQTSAIPEHEYIWQGDFEVHRSGRVTELCPGIQAHLSTCASPRVIDMVNKFACQVPLTEVSRLSTWPTQFNDCGPTEDHIALYFFAKDVESYERNYRSLLESMMKNDVALKASIDGVELLIFPSNQLPKKSQRWNMFFFLWGVFRARRVSCSDHMLNPSKKLNVSSLDIVTMDKDYPSHLMSFSENLCLPSCTDEESSGCERICSSVLDSNTPSSFKVPILPSPETIDGNRDAKLSSLEQMFSGFQAKAERPDGRLNLLRIPGSSTQLYTESGNGHTSQEENGEDCKLDVELPPPIQASSFYRSVEMSMHHDILNDRRESKCPVNIHSVSSQNADSFVRLGAEKMDPLIGTDKVKTEKNVKDEEGSDMEISPDRDTVMRDSSMKEPSSWQLNHRKRPHFDLMEVASEASSTCTNDEMLQNDAKYLFAGRENIIKKLKTESNGVYGGDSCIDKNAIWDDNVSETRDSGPISSGKQKSDEAWDGMKTTEDPGYAERYFFPVVSLPVNEYRVGDSSIPWNSISSDNEVWLHSGVSNRHHDHVPNLDLALGAETKPPKQEILPLTEQGILPFFVGTVDTKKDMERPTDTFTTKEEEDDVTASLSLSLSFPFGEKERSINAAKKTEPLLSERRHVNTPFLLFKGFPDK